MHATIILFTIVLSLCAYIIISAYTAGILRSWWTDQTDKEMAVACGFFWPVTIPVLLLIWVVKLITKSRPVVRIVEYAEERHDHTKKRNKIKAKGKEIPEARVV